MSGIVGLGIIVLIVLALVGIYNGLVTKRVATEGAWAQIDVQLKRRYDLIPNLVETVKGYATHEKETLERVIQARNSALSASTATNNVGAVSQAESALSGALRQIFALAENYPQLKANDNFSRLQEELASTENRIGFARQHYNDSVADYNASLEKVPSNFVAGFGGFTRKEFFQLDAAEAQAAKAPPKVSF
jgi:LemA protein